LLALLAAGAACGEAAFEARVIAVKDGDSLLVRRSGASPSEDIRIFGIDAPERNQPWSRRAREALSERAFGKVVRIEPVDRDRHGRTVARVYADGVSVGEAQVREGHAWVYRKYDPSKPVLALEAEARAARRGLWSLPEPPVPPWEWRRGAREPGAPRPALAPEAAGFACGGKAYCREMRSCAEARFHLAECGLARLDGDGDGVPCETLCGGSR
jgi:endonuclease YncB( thermonuclease family)